MAQEMAFYNSNLKQIQLVLTKARGQVATTKYKKSDS